MTRLSFLPQPFVKISLATRLDLTAYVIAGIHNEVARVWRVNADDSNGGELKFTGGAGKDDSVEVAICGDGSVLVAVSEASGAGASGSTSQPDVQRIAGVFPPYPGGTVDQPARNQANAATNMAHTALSQNEALEIRVTTLESL